MRVRFGCGLDSRIYGNYCPILHSDPRVRSFTLVYPFDTDKVSTISYPEVGANLLIDRRGLSAQIIPSFLLNIKLGVNNGCDKFRMYVNFST